MNTLVALTDVHCLEPGELHAMHAAGFEVYSSATMVPRNSFVLARHYAWPWPKRLDNDLSFRGSSAINDASAYAFADSVVSWSHVLGDLTPKTWTRLEDLPEDRSFILKGKKSDKGRWDRMFAKDKAEAIRLYLELCSDSGFRSEDLVIREYKPLVRLGENIGGCPISEEYRVFCYRSTELCRAFYWNEQDCSSSLFPGSADRIPQDFLDEAIARVADSGQIAFYTLDVARCEDGSWTVIEVSDGQRAGLSENSPSVLYRNLADAIVRDKASEILDVTAQDAIRVFVESIKHDCSLSRLWAWAMGHLDHVLRVVPMLSEIQGETQQKRCFLLDGLPSSSDLVLRLNFNERLSPADADKRATPIMKRVDRVLRGIDHLCLVVHHFFVDEEDLSL